MYNIFILFFVSSFYLLAIDTDFDGVDDEVDSCLKTGMLDIVTVDGCSKKQKSNLRIMFLQTYSNLKLDNNEKVDNYSLALLLSKDSWIFYVGSGYFRYDTKGDTIKDFGDTSILVQKRFILKPNHYVKSSLSMVLPTYSDDANKVDYGMDISYGYFYKKFDLELSYKYDLINDDNRNNIQTGYLYLGYWVIDDLQVTLGYSNDSEERKNKIVLLQYLYSDKMTFSYSFIDTTESFYENIHSFGMGYSF